MTTEANCPVVALFITKQLSARRARPTMTLPKDAQFTCACSPTKMKAQKCFLRLRTQPRHHTPHLLDNPPEATVLKHLIQPRGAKTRVRFQRLAS